MHSDSQPTNPRHDHTTRNRAFVLTGLGVSLGIAFLLSPFASSHPDGLDRVAEDLAFQTAESENPPAQSLPFATLFEGYALKGVPPVVATPLAGVIGTLATFGLAWGMGKLTIRGKHPSSDSSLE